MHDHFRRSSRSRLWYPFGSVNTAGLVICIDVALAFLIRDGCEQKTYYSSVRFGVLERYTALISDFLCIACRVLVREGARVCTNYMSKERIDAVNRYGSIASAAR